MTKQLDVTLGKLESTSAWGSAVVNGITARNSLRIKCYDNGFVLEVMKLLGGGKLWLPKYETTIGEVVKSSFFKPTSLQLNYKNHKIIIYGKLLKTFG